MVCRGKCGHSMRRSEPHGKPGPAPNLTNPEDILSYCGLLGNFLKSNNALGTSASTISASGNLLLPYSSLGKKNQLKGIAGSHIYVVTFFSLEMTYGQACMSGRQSKTVILATMAKEEGRTGGKALLSALSGQ